ncbi:AmmeMemoRadiSam system radical SAM enzyme [Aestuariirhabdus sp. LZHN29]|uniref:AmmeMemoRadiSam system radical SAM enzyme n=1 Tax=Aestuariirhabdus sp. LZHN29 TaxID=3417462 RepID=UPI003CF29B44
MTQADQHCIPVAYWHSLDDGRLQCDLCPRLCKLHEGQRGLCFVRLRQQNQLWLTSYGRSSGFCIDPIEKKPLNHFLPGTPVLSFGTAGCNLACKFCQNWDMSKSREMSALSERAMPAELAATAARHGCRSVAFTYNDPVSFLEYAVDTAEACRAHNVCSVAVTAGYICEQPRERFFSVLDAANVDLKAFDERFYYKLCGGHLQPVLETLQYIVRETSVWLEITTLLIPGENDSDRELTELSEWVVGELGGDVPLHFSAYHPDWKFRSAPATPPATLTRARTIARKAGVNHVYTGNVHDPEGGSSWCSHCGALLIERDWYRLGAWGLDSQGCCTHCGKRLPGVFEPSPGHWGARRQPLHIEPLN